MANRVVLGAARGTFGLFVSKPGLNVLTCDDEDLLFASNQGGTFLQVLAKGSVTLNSSTGSSLIVDVPSAGSGDYLGVFWQRSDGTTAKSRDNFNDYKISVTQTFPSAGITRCTFETTSNTDQSITYLITTMRAS